MHPKDAAGIANSVDPDQNAHIGAVWSGSALFPQTYLAENITDHYGILNYEQFDFPHGEMHPKDAHRMTNSVNPDQTAP